MAINKNHEFEDLDGTKCAIVEKNVSKERIEFLKKIWGSIDLDEQSKSVEIPYDPLSAHFS